MRQIKFRAWDKGCKLMWNNAYILCDSIECAGLKNNNKACTSDHENRFILMQYTGLLDKNKVEIYEGDIIKCWYGTGIVTYLVSGFCLENPNHHWKYNPKVSHPQSIFALDGPGFRVNTKIIGNIYENKELLED